MKFVSIKHYVEHSYEGNPSFVILMDNKKEYISNGCVFVENTPENINRLVNRYRCREYITELMESPSIDIIDLTNTCHMFHGSKLTEFDIDLPNVVDANYMFYDTKLLVKFDSDMPNLIHADAMFCYSGLKKFSNDVHNLQYAESMFQHSQLKTFTSQLPEIYNAGWMFFNSNITEFTIDMPKVRNTQWMFAETNITKYTSKIPDIPHKLMF